ncbi:MAG: Na(+)-translocating NADH-quinone reductase subunit A [Bacteroidales bacterium]|nr:Na(+)-translocating NADH-quinone reductase subunit A [Bacteroidales bacterium]
MIKIKKGLDLPIEGAAERRISDACGVSLFAVKPTDYVGLVPRLLVAEGDKVSAGDALFCDKNDERIRFASPVNGEVKTVVRGEKRKLLAVVVQASANAPTIDETSHSRINVSDTEALRSRMLEEGLWPLLRQRPFGTVAGPDSSPKAIVVSCFDSAPLAPDYDYVMQGREGDFCTGLETLAALTEGSLFVTFRPGQQLARTVEQHVASHLKNVKVEYFDGPHPAGNVGTQIARLCPINKGDTVWTVTVQDVATIGHWVATGVYHPIRVIAVAGPQARNPHYYRTLAGASVETLVRAQILNPTYPALQAGGNNSGSVRVVSGNVLSGTCIGLDGFIGAYDSLLTLLPEGNYYDFMGWLLPGFKKHSFSRTFMSGFVPQCMVKAFTMLPDCLKPNFDTNLHGGVRPLVFTGNFERVFPFDIYPLQLLKACIIGDIELMEKLGIYEVEPEDFALCEYIDPSKTDIQPIIREALEKLRKEAI